MSAALVDEFTFEYAVPAARARRVGHRPLAAVNAPAPTRRSAPCDHGVPILGPARPSLRLTDRGIAVVLALFVGLFFAGLAVLVGAFLAVSDAPVHAAPAVASGVVSVIGG